MLLEVGKSSHTEEREKYVHMFEVTKEKYFVYEFRLSKESKERLSPSSRCMWLKTTRMERDFVKKIVRMNINWSLKHWIHSTLCAHFSNLDALKLNQAIFQWDTYGIWDGVYFAGKKGPYLFVSAGLEQVVRTYVTITTQMWFWSIVNEMIKERSKEAS